MSHFQRNVIRFSFGRIFRINEPGLNFDMTPRRTLNPINCKIPWKNDCDKSSLVIICEHETIYECATCVTVLIETDEFNMQMIIPHHKKKRQEKHVKGVKSPVEEQNISCNCSRRDIHCRHKFYWSISVILMVGSLVEHFVIIIHLLIFHVINDTRTRLAQKKLTQLFMFPKMVF